MKTTFDDYLLEVFLKIIPSPLDDDIEDGFNDWYGKLEPTVLKNLEIEWGKIDKPIALSGLPVLSVKSVKDIEESKKLVKKMIEVIKLKFGWGKIK